MEIPDLVRERLGDEEIRAGVSIGDEDAVCLTPTRTLIYRGEGLLSDESITVLSLDVERIDVSDGRRKTKFVLAYVDGEESFTVPGNRAEKVLELLLEGVLRVADVADADESVLGVYRFSELALILTEGRLVKHVGSSVWDEDFEEFPFADVTGLEFEEGSVATQIVLSIDGRPQRIKAPNDEAPMLRQTLAEALCDFHGSDSLAALNDLLGPDEDEPAEDADDSSGGSGGLTLDEGIDPLVGGDADERSAGSSMEDPRATGSTETAGEGGGADSTASAGGDTGEGAAGGGAAGGGVAGDGAAGETRTDDSQADAGNPSEDGRPAGTGDDPGTGEGDQGTTAAGAGSAADADVGPLDEAPPTADVGAGVSRADVEAIGDQMETLTTAVKRQNELLRKQQQTIKRLVEELRQGR